MLEFLKPKIDIQLNVPLEKPRDIDSEIDWKIIDQLHNAVLNFSKNSMQSKKIMFTLLGVFVAASLQAPSLLVVSRWFPLVIVIVLFFWTFDAFTYYYQEKLRSLMDARFKALKRRYSDMDGSDDFTLPNNREHGCRVSRSFFNGSVAFYPVIVILVLGCWALIKIGVII